MKILESLKRLLIFRKTPENSQITQIYNSGGIKLYGFKSVLKLPTKRALALHNVLNETSLRVAEDDLDAYQELMKEAFNEKNFSQLGYYIETLTAYRSMYSNTKNMFRIGSAFILLPGESLTEMDRQSEKQKLFEQNDDVKAFFLNTVHDQLMKLTSSKNSLSIVDYLKNPVIRKTENQFLKSIGRSGGMVSRSV